MNLFVEFNTIKVVTAHKLLVSMFKHHAQQDIESIPDRFIESRGISRKHLIAYKAFADACYEMKVGDINYYCIKNLKAYLNRGSIWTFDYTIKRGIFRRKESYLFHWDEEAEAKLKEAFKKKGKR